MMVFVSQDWIASKTEPQQNFVIAIMIYSVLSFLHQSILISRLSHSLMSLELKSFVKLYSGADVLNSLKTNILTAFLSFLPRSTSRTFRSPRASTCHQIFHLVEPVINSLWRFFISRAYFNMCGAVTVVCRLDWTQTSHVPPHSTYFMICLSLSNQQRPFTSLLLKSSLQVGFLRKYLGKPSSLAHLNLTEMF